MRRELRAFLGGVIVALLAVALLYFAAMRLPVKRLPSAPDGFSALRKAREIQRCITRNYLGEIDEAEQAEYMAAAQVAALDDPYSLYYTKEQYEALSERRKGEHVGIGINFSKRAEDGLLLVHSVEEGSPAETGGMQAGDIIRSIDGEDAAEMETSDVTAYIQEHAGSALSFVVLRGEAEDAHTLSITPGEYQSVTVTSELRADNVGYLQIRQFSAVTVEQFDAALASLKEAGMEALILDLRDNGGGLLESACEVARRILPAGVIVYEEDKGGARKYHENEADAAFSYPLAVLVNGDTASAAEILAGAIRDYGVGTIVGEKTYGKGIVQNYYVLGDGSVLQLTTTHYFTPEGDDIHETGITPQIEAADVEETGRDEALDAAVEALKK